MPATLEDAVLQMLPLMRSLGFTETDLREHVRECIEHMRTDMQSAEWEGGDIDLQYAACIRSYTHEEPPCYRVMSGALNNTAARMQGLRLSEAVRMVLPYCKLLDVSLQALPACFHYQGVVYRGVKWAFPNLRNHRLHFPHYFHAAVSCAGTSQNLHPLTGKLLRLVFWVIMGLALFSPCISHSATRFRDSAYLQKTRSWCQC